MAFSQGVRLDLLGALRTDLHGILYIFHGSVGGYLILFKYFFGRSPGPLPREPVRKISYYPRFRQLLVGFRVQAPTYGKGVNKELSRYQGFREFREGNV